jgi:AcrR family transcriptional regulator
MGVAERKEREKVEMRKLILSAATQIFLREGFDKTSLRNIAEEIEYSPATIYLYFKDKDELFFAIQEEGFNIFFQKMGVLGTFADPYERLIKLGAIYMEFALEFREYYDLMFLMKAPMRAIEECEWECGVQAHEALENIVKECIEKGYFKNKDYQATAFMIWSFMHGLVSLELMDRLKIYGDTDKKELIQRTFLHFGNLLKCV